MARRIFGALIFVWFTLAAIGSGLGMLLKDQERPQANLTWLIFNLIGALFGLSLAVSKPQPPTSPNEPKPPSPPASG